MNKIEIKQALTAFQTQREELLPFITKQAWKNWLTSPSAWVQYVTAHFTPAQQQAITEYVLTDRSGDFYTIKDTIMWVYNFPDEIKYLKSLSEMLAEHGEMAELVLEKEASV